MVSMMLQDERERTTGVSPLLTVRQVADLLGVHVRTIWRLSGLAEVGESEFPLPIRITGRIVRWRRGDIDRYLKGMGGSPADGRGGQRKGEMGGKSWPSRRN